MNPMRIAALTGFLLAAPVPPRTVVAEAPPLHLLRTIALPGVGGRLDHLAVDGDGQRLFVAALGNDSVEVVDLRSGTRTASLHGLHEPQGIAFAPALHRLFVANGGSGTVSIFDAATLAPAGSIAFGTDADNLRLDAAHNLLYVGYGTGALGVADAAAGTRRADIAMPGHPEAFSLEPGSNRLFVNVPSARQVAVVDRERRAVVATWRLSGDNFPMALDAARRRLFIGLRSPPALRVLDAGTGRALATLAADADADDLFFDARRGRLYLSCGSGFLDVYTRQDADRYERSARLPTAPGARTALFAATLDRLFVAAPRRGDSPAAVRVYAPEP